MPSDPRVFFAAERTLLAWVRTGIAVVGLGFVVSRFGLFLRLIALQIDPGRQGAGHGYSNLIGVALVLVGAVSIAAACVQHGRFVATLEPHDRPERYSRAPAIWIAGLLSAASAVLALYLLAVPQ